MAAWCEASELRRGRRECIDQVDDLCLEAGTARDLEQASRGTVSQTAILWTVRRRNRMVSGGTVPSSVGFGSAAVE